MKRLFIALYNVKNGKLKIGGINMHKNNTTFGGISLLVISILTLIGVGSNIIGVELPNIMIRIMGVVNIIAMTILIYISLKRKNKFQSGRANEYNTQLITGELVN